MRRLRFMMIAVLVAAAPASALAAGGAGASGREAPRAVLSGLVCQTALDPPARAVSVTAVMRPVPGTEKLSVEFQLLERAADAGASTPWALLVAPGLGSWVSPTDPATLGQRAADVWIVKKPIADLGAPASYRFRVSFRWLGTKGAVLQTTTLTSKVCHQPELRPDLAVTSVSVNPAKKASGDAYSAVIENLGATGAGPFTVELSDAGAVLDERTVQHLAAHAGVTVTFQGPACDPGQPPVVTADPNDDVDVFTRAQASLIAQCPGVPTTTTPTSTSPASTAPPSTTATTGTTTSATGKSPGPGANGIPVSS